MSRKLPIRTYQRKNIPNPLIKTYNSTPIDLLSRIDDTSKKQHEIDNIKDDKINEDSLNCDPFETTFDRIAKDAVVPPIPFDCIDNKSWYDSSFDTSNEKKKQNESLFHISIGTPTIIVNPYISCVKTCMKMSSDNKTKKKKKKTCNTKGLSKSKNTKELTTLTKENHFEISKKKKKLRKGAKKKENESNNTETLYCGFNSNSYKLQDQHTINTGLNEMCNNENITNTNVTLNRNIYKKRTNVLHCSKSKIHNPLKETINTLNIHDKEKICSLKSFNKVQKFCKENDQNYSSILNLEIKPCSVILNKDNIKEWKLMLNKSNNIKTGDSNNVLNDSIKITSQLPINNTNFKENVICSTPITTRKKRLATCSILCSPINTTHVMKSIQTNENDTNLSANQPQQTKLFTLDQISVINLTNAELCTKDNTIYEGNTMNRSLSSKTNMDDVQEQKVIHLGTYESSINFINNRERYDTVFMDDSIDLKLRQKNSKAHSKHNSLLNVLNTSVETNRSRSLFNDSESKLHSLTSDDNMSSDKLLTNTNAQKSNAHSNLKLQLQLSSSNVYNDDEIGKLEMSQQKESCELTISIKEESVEKSIKRENEDTEDECYSELYTDQNQLNINETNTFLTQIQNSVQVTKRRERVWKRNFDLSDIRENDNDFVKSSTFQIPRCSEKVNGYSTARNPTKNLADTSTNTAAHYDNKNISVNRCTSFTSEKCVFLKPGKFWTRSLSILHNFQNGLNLNKVAIEKGKKWRYSVQSILEMQKNDFSLSCREVDEYIDRQQLSNETQTKSFNEITTEYNTDKTTFSKRFTGRISVRVVRNSRCIQNNDDISFLEVYGISTNTQFEFTRLETNCTAKCNTQYSNNGNNYSEICSSKTAKEVVLQRCSQKNYLLFEECFPHMYTKHCQKIGEGVYGEVFLYKEDMQKSVLKIIPIEGDQLVNGEPQKKFSEILSEIVIVKELHNLRFSKIHSTSGFVEVKSIKCIKGKYPEEMVNLWKHYDNVKTSDNDCPSMFDENQLYIVFELGHGGQDLEAFEFHTAFEAHTLFIQTALALAVAEKSFEFEHRDLHWGNILISCTDEQYIHYKIDNKDIFLPSNGVKVCIIDFTLSRMLYQGCCIFNDLALDPVLFTAQGEYQFEIYRLMRNKIQNNWQEYEPYTNILWLHYILDKMVTIVRYKKKNIKKHKNAISMLQNLKEVILSYQSAYDFVNNCDQITSLVQNISA